MSLRPPVCLWGGVARGLEEVRFILPESLRFVLTGAIREHVEQCKRAKAAYKPRKNANAKTIQLQRQRLEQDLQNAQLLLDLWGDAFKRCVGTGKRADYLRWLADHPTIESAGVVPKDAEDDWDPEQGQLDQLQAVCAEFAKNPPERKVLS